jgi:ketoreductase RED2
MGALDGKVALVTGSSSGIGAAVAQRFADEGASVLVNSASSVEAGEKLAASLPDAVYVQGDVGDEAQAKGLVQAAVERWGRLDVLVNNAGWTKAVAHADLEAADAEMWDRVLRVNLLGPWFLAQAAVPHLRTSTGCIVNVSSVGSVRPLGSSIPYAVSKAALNHMTRLLAHALGPEVRVNAVAPGLVTTPWTDRYPEVHEHFAGIVPMRRSGSSEEIAEICLALTQWTYVTGEVVLADGGTHLVTAPPVTGR